VRILYYPREPHVMQQHSLILQEPFDSLVKRGVVLRVAGERSVQQWEKQVNHQRIGGLFAHKDVDQIQDAQLEVHCLTPILHPLLLLRLSENCAASRVLGTGEYAELCTQ